MRLHDGIRVNAVLPPVSPHGTLLSIRLPRVIRLDVTRLDQMGFFAVVPAGTVRQLVADRRNLLITGAGGSGKTTALGALLGLADPSDRIVTIAAMGWLLGRRLAPVGAGLGVAVQGAALLVLDGALAGRFSPYV